MTTLDDDIVALFTRRVYDMAGVTDSSVKVYLNGKRVAVNGFKEVRRRLSRAPRPRPAPAGAEVAASAQLLTGRASCPRAPQYVDLFLGPKLGGQPRVFEKVSDRWEVAIAASDDGFQQFSFTNAIATTKGGTHVNHVSEQVVEKVLEHLKKKHKGLDKILKPNHVKGHLKVFVNCLIENPAFDSQTKENMTLKVSAFGAPAAHCPRPHPRPGPRPSR